MRELIIVFLLAFTTVLATNFTIINGQIFTPGLAIVDAPQPNTPLGGDTLQVALDISGDGKLSLPPYPTNAPTAFHSITIFLFSYVTGLNLTITNGTASSGNASLGNVLLLEPGSTVKHVNWLYPSCLVGNGFPTSQNSTRGAYNISLHQNYILNFTNYYTIFNLPISVSNEISANPKRPSCDSLKNQLLGSALLIASADIIPPNKYPWTNGNAAQTNVPDETTGAPSQTIVGSSATAAGTSAMNRGTFFNIGGSGESSRSPSPLSLLLIVGLSVSAFIYELRDWL